MRPPSGISLIILSIVLTGSLGAAFSTKANAAPITFNVTGTLEGFDGPPLAPLAVGQHYSATFTFDSNAAATPVFGGGNNYFGAISAASFSIDTYSGTLAIPSATLISVLDNNFGHTDFYGAFLGDPGVGTPGVVNAPPVTGPVGDLLPDMVELVALEDDFPPLDGLSSSNLPLTPPDISNFDTARWVINFESLDGSLFGRARGSIDSFTLVPEPATLSLLGLAFAGMGLATRRSLICRRVVSSLWRKP